MPRSSATPANVGFHSVTVSDLGTRGFVWLYVGVHFPSDVLAGAILGTLCAWFVLGGRRPATHQSTLPPLLRDGATVRP